jgi:hypothetical protein
MPGISQNADGTLRSVTGWPKGALSGNQGEGLVLWLSFNGWDGTSTVLDGSGNGNDALMFGTTVNHPTPISGPIGYGAASIADNQYFGVVNPNGFSSLAEGSVAAWARYGTNSYGNSLILDAGYDGETNSWRLGRVDGNVNTMFTVYDQTNGARMYKVSFPDPGPSTNWNHYAVTWDGTHIVGYYNGASISTNVQTVPFLRVASLNNWMAIGTMHHQGTPQWGDDQYPNCCYLNGGVSDIRIYNRALSASGISSLYLGRQTKPPPPAGLRIQSHSSLGPSSRFFEGVNYPLASSSAIDVFPMRELAVLANDRFALAKPGM